MLLAARALLITFSEQMVLIFMCQEVCPHSTRDVNEAGEE